MDHCETCGHVGCSPDCPNDGEVRFPNTRLKTWGEVEGAPD